MVPETVRRLEQSYRSCERASRRLCPPGRSPTTRHQGLEISRQGSSAHPGVIQGGRLRSDRDLASCDGQGDGERDPKDERSDEEREDHFADCASTPLATMDPTLRTRGTDARTRSREGSARARTGKGPR